MIFLPLILIAILLYILGYKISSMIIFLFFLTEGFNLVPPESWETDLGFSKGKDFAFFTLLGFLTINFFFRRESFTLDPLKRYILLFMGLVVLSMLNSRFVLGLPLGDIIRTVRYQFFWLSIFVFMSLSKEQLTGILNVGFYISLILACLYVIQVMTDASVLVEGNVSRVEIFGRKIRRYYNQPEMLYFFAFMSIYKNPIKNYFRYVTIAIFIAACVLAFHRSWNGFLVVSLAIGFLINLPKVQKVKIAIISAAILIPAVIFTANKFMKSRTYEDLVAVADGDFSAFESLRANQESTFMFRIGHVWERILYIEEHPRARFIGGGLITEDSDQLDKYFDFKVGVVEELTNRTAQLDTSDIVYSLLLIRYGYLGSILFMLIYVYLAYFFYKYKENKYALFSFIFLILMFGVSFFSDSLLRFSYVIPILISYAIVKKSQDESIEEQKQHLSVETK